MNFGEDLSLLVTLANRSYQLYLSKVFSHIDIFPFYQVLLTLNRLGGQCTQKKLCYELRMEKSNMVAVIDQLVKKQYVSREVNYKDRRGKLIRLLPQTYDLIGELETEFGFIESEVTEDLTWQEMYNCIRVLTRVNDKFRVLAEKKEHESKPAGKQIVA